MRITKITTLISLLIVGSFLSMSCQSRAKRSETVSTPRIEKTERTETPETDRTTESRTSADLGAPSAGRSR